MTGERGAVGRRRAAASCRPPARGSPAATTTTTARPSRSPPTAGSRPATSPRSTPSGYMRLVDRTKDVVKSGGEWISSVELENEIMAHPKVAEAAVIGVKHPKWSERPLACVVRAGRGRSSPRTSCSSSSTAGWPSGGCPTTWCSSTRSPRPPSGKFSKKDLRDPVRRPQAPRHLTARAARSWLTASGNRDAVSQLRRWRGAIRRRGRGCVA